MQDFVLEGGKGIACFCMLHDHTKTLPESPSKKKEESIPSHQVSSTSWSICREILSSLRGGGNPRFPTSLYETLKSNREGFSSINWDNDTAAITATTATMTVTATNNSNNNISNISSNNNHSSSSNNNYSSNRSTDKRARWVINTVPPFLSLWPIKHISVVKNLETCKLTELLLNSYPLSQIAFKCHKSYPLQNALKCHNSYPLSQIALKRHNCTPTH